MIDIKKLTIIDGFFIRNLRVSNGDSGLKLANALNVSKTYLYSIENGNNNTSDEFLQNVLNYYNVKYNRSVYLYEDAHSLVTRIYECIILKNDELLARYEEEFNKKIEVFKYSRGFIFIQLIQAIVNIKKNKDLSISSIDNASRYLLLYDSNIAYIYGIVYGFIKGIGYNLADSKKVVFDIYDSYPSHDTLPIIKGMFYYQLGRIVYEEKSYLKSLRYYQEAIANLQKTYCVERINQVNIEIANILLRLRLYDEAEKKYLELLEEAEIHSFKRRMKVCLSNLSYLYLLQKKYDKCEEYVMLAKEKGSVYYNLNYYLAYCVYKTKPKNIARSIISKLIDEEEDRYTSRMMKMIQGFVNDNESKIDKYFEMIKKSLTICGEKLEMNLLYGMIISYYVKKNSDKCAKLVEEYLSLLIS